ncbi:MAG: InlB B-repeat-containing protein, partial [Lachnospiraceae bacterium]|nr:InlB B-repeat-containing protein [Lachnospiraceae bacterium]
SRYSVYALTYTTDKCFEVSFDPAGGSPVAKQSVKENGLVRKPADPTKNGYTFNGWYSGDTAWDFDSNTVTSDLELTAKWTEKTTPPDPPAPTRYTLTVTNGTGSGSYTAGTPVTIRANDPESGKRFKEWTGAEELTFTAGSAKSAEATFTMPAKAVAVAAGYEDIPENAFTVSFDLNGKPGTAPPAQIVEKDGTATMPADPLAEGFSFIGWYTESDCRTKYDFAAPVTADITLYAKWKGVDRTVTFDMGGKASNITEKVENGQPVSKPAADPEADGFIFTGWFEDKACTTEYVFTTPVIKDTTIYAGWREAKQYTVTFDANKVEAMDMPAPQNVEEGKTAMKPATDPSADGYIFTGWFADREGKSRYTFKEKITANTTIYAGWKENGVVEPGTGSALDNRPEITSATTDIYLVKGQKFYIGKDWEVTDKTSKKYVSVDKKGYLKAKKAPKNSDIITIKMSGHPDITVHICQPTLSDKKKTLEITETEQNPTHTLTITKDANIKNILWYSAAPDVATVDQDGKVTAVAKGKAKITAYVNGSAYNCTITVKERAVAKKRTLHVNLKGSRKISVKGVYDWTSADPAIAEKAKKGDKFTAKNAGKTVLTASANDIKYTIDFYAEDITVTGEKVAGGNKNKYTINDLKVGTAADIALPGVQQDVVFKSSKPDVAFVDEEGHIVARSKGTGKLTTKINGKTITITVRVTE